MEQAPLNQAHGSVENFLIAEYQSVLNRSLTFEEVKANRINFYLFLLGAVIAGFGSLVSIPFVQANIYVIGTGTAIFLGLLGWQTLMHSVQYSMVITSLYRISGRTRRWFYDQHPSVLPYLAFEPADDKPALMLGDLAKKNTNWWDISPLLWRGGEPILLSINAMMGGILAGLPLMGCLSAFSLSFQVASLWGFLAFGVGTAVSWRMQVLRIKKVLQQRNAGLSKRTFFAMSQKEYFARVEDVLGRDAKES